MNQHNDNSKKVWYFFYGLCILTPSAVLLLATAFQLDMPILDSLTSTVDASPRAGASHDSHLGSVGVGGDWAGQPAISASTSLGTSHDSHLDLVSERGEAVQATIGSKLTKSSVRIAIMSVGMSRKSDAPVLKGYNLDGQTLAVLKKRNITNIIDTHYLHILKPLRDRGMEAHYFVCTDKLPKAKLPEYVSDAYLFKASSQKERVRACAERIRNRSGIPSHYQVFIKIRPDFLVLSDIPELSPAIPARGEQASCMVRLRAAKNISGVMNDMVAIPTCTSVDAGSLRPGTGFVIDDIVAVVPQQYIDRFWGDSRGAFRIPSSFPVGPGWAETQLTRIVLTQGVPMSVLRLRGWPLRSGVHVFQADHRKRGNCNYPEGPPVVVLKGSSSSIPVSDLPRVMKEAGLLS